MIINMDNTTVADINRRLIHEREEGGAVALSRVLTLVIDAGHADVEPAIEAANTASREHPCRVIALVQNDDIEGELHGQLRLGHDAGASEVVLLGRGQRAERGINLRTQRRPRALELCDKLLCKVRWLDIGAG